MGETGIASAATVDLRCRNCGSSNLTPVTPYWSRCAQCGEITYTPRQSAGEPAATVLEPTATRYRYSAETLPLPVRIDPRRRLIGWVLGLVAASLFVISIPLAIVSLAASNGISYSDVFYLSGVSLIATLWIFQSVSFTAVGAYGSILVLRRKAEARAGWISFGIIAASLSAIFFLLARLSSAWVGIVAGILLVVAGVLNILKATQPTTTL